MSSSAGSRFAKLFLSQLGFKLISFAITSLLTRALLPSAKGIGFVMDMYFTAGSFLCRESVRSLHARLPLTPDKVPAILGSGFFCALVGLAIIIPFSLLHAATSLDPQLGQILFADPSSSSSTIIGYLSSAPIIVPGLCLVFLIEMLAETHWNIAPFYRGGIEDKATAESFSLIAKNLGIASVVYFPSFFPSSSSSSKSSSDDNDEFTTLQRATVGFAVGQAAYSLLFYLFSARIMASINNNSKDDVETNNNNPKLPQENFIKIGNFLHFTKFRLVNMKSALSLYFMDPPKLTQNNNNKNNKNDFADAPNYIMSQFIQENILRLILTEGEKFVLTSSGVVSLSAQGAFEVASSLGKLVTRILFRLWEEFCFNEWAKGAASISSFLLENNNNKNNNNKDQNGLAVLQSNVDLLQNMCRLAASIGVLACCFGPLLSGRILQVLFGSRWATKEASDILAVYLLSLPLFGLNGLLEAFCRALSSPLEMKKTRTQLLVVSFSYLAAAFLSLRYFSHGDVKVLIVVNAIQFILRIIIGLNVSKGIVDRLRKELLVSSGDEHCSTVAYLKQFCPSKYFLGYCVVVGVAGSLVISPYSSRFDLESENQNYVVPFKKDVLLMILGVVAAVVAVVSDSTAVERIKSIINSRRGEKEKKTN